MQHLSSCPHRFQVAAAEHGRSSPTRASSATPEATAPRSFCDIPRPPTTGVLGNLLDWRRPDELLQILQRYEQQCGALARIPLGPIDMLLVTDPRLSRKVLQEEVYNRKGRFYALTRLVLGNILVLNGEPWRRLRRQYAGALSTAQVLAPANLALDAGLSGLRGPASVDLEPYTWDLAANACFRILCSEPVPAALRDDLKLIQRELGTLAIDIGFRPWSAARPWRWVKLRRARARVEAYFERLVRARGAEGGDSSDVLDGLLAVCRTGSSPDTRVIVDALMNFFFTADDVLACALRWCLYTLGRHPEVQAELRAEIDEHAPRGPITAEALARMPALACVARESMRLYPGYSVFGRTSDHDTVLAGHRIPASTELLVSPMVMHRSARLWDEPDAFRPQRWLELGEPTSAPGRGEHPGYIPFGAGLRSCLAAGVAWPLLRMMIARVARSAHIEVEPGHEAQMCFLGTIHSANGLRVRLRPRGADGVPSP